MPKADPRLPSWPLAGKRLWRKRQYNLSSMLMALIISAVLAIIGINWLRVQPLQLLFGLSFIILASSLLGKQVETRHALSLPGYGRFVLGFLYFVIIFIVAGSAFFYLWQLGNFQISLIVVSLRFGKSGAVVNAMSWPQSAIRPSVSTLSRSNGHTQGGIKFSVWV